MIPLQSASDSLQLGSVGDRHAGSNDLSAEVGRSSE